jgi:hypothetical protein
MDEGNPPPPEDGNNPPVEPQQSAVGGGGDGYINLHQFFLMNHPMFQQGNPNPYPQFLPFPLGNYQPPPTGRNSAPTLPGQNVAPHLVTGASAPVPSRQRAAAKKSNAGGKEYTKAEIKILAA